MKKLFLLLFVGFMNLYSQTEIDNTRWSNKKADEWYKSQKWLIGCNFTPGSAINQLEMWQKETFDTVTIDKELGFAESIGFNIARVFLHSIVWENDQQDLKKRIDIFLKICDSHKIKVMFVLFDDCWNKEPKKGKQPEPKPGVHNSGWVQCPGELILNDSSKWEMLKQYTKDILKSFSDDPRIILWDLYNEPGNSGYKNKSLPLLKNVFAWVREVNPSQPISSGVYDKGLKDINEFLLNNSDIITFHNYGKVEEMENNIKEMLEYERPVICTEYMARTNNSLFKTHLPILKKYNIGAINWGLVSGKTNTIFPWGSKEGSLEPKIWFHDIFRIDGTPFDKEETDFILELSRTK